MSRNTELRKPEGWFIRLKGGGEQGPYTTRDEARRARQVHLRQLVEQQEQENERRMSNRRETAGDRG